jgi:hypothetical protein
MDVTEAFGKGSFCEGDPGALHRGGHAVGVDGADAGRGNPVVLMDTFSITTTRKNPALAPDSGHRWR